jgi:HSP20 family protein
MKADIQKPESQTTKAERLAPRTTLTPPVDVLENKDVFLIRADFPGVEQQDVDIRFEKNTLTLQGPFKQGNHAYLWARSFVLPGGIDADKIQAQLKDGVLAVTLPKQESLKPRQIPVRAA